MVQNHPDRIFLLIAVTFRATGFGRGGGVSIYNIQKEVGRVVVGLTEVTCSTDHGITSQYQRGSGVPLMLDGTWWR